MVDADRISPTPENWSLVLPKGNTKDPLIIRFGESLDHALATKALEIIAPSGQPINGNVVLQKEDTEWVFTPSNNWKASSYSIQIKAELEDVAGNNLNRLFDRNIEKEDTLKKSLPYYSLDFLIK